MRNNGQSSVCNTNVTLCNTICNTNVTQNVTKDDISNNPDYICKYCNQTFNSHPSYYRHMKHYCSVKISKEEKYKRKLKKEIRKEIKEEYKLVPYSSNANNSHNTNSHNTTNNIINNNNNNIIIKNFGCEDTSHLTDDFMYKMLRGPYGMMLPLIKKIHLDPNKPENKNIKIPNIRDNKVKIFDQNEWKYKDMNDTIRDMVDCKYYLIDIFYTDKKKNHNEEFSKNIKQYQDSLYKKFQEKYDNEDITLLKNLFKECKLALLTLRDDLNHSEKNIENSRENIENDEKNIENKELNAN